MTLIFITPSVSTALTGKLAGEVRFRQLSRSPTKMAILSNASNSYIIFLKVFLISTGVLSMAVLLKLSVPVVAEFLLSELPPIWNFVVSCLRPPYLYLVINCIIITIVASSKLQQKVDDSPETAVQPVEAMKIAGDVRMDYEVAYDGVVSKAEVRPEFGYGYDANAVKVVEMVEPEPEPEYGDVGARVSEVKTIVNGSEMDGGDEFVISRSSLTPQRQESMEFSGWNEKPPVSVRFGHRKPFKASPEAGKALRVSKPKRHDTLESTWKTITEGRPMPLTRHLKKSDTWETHGRHNPQDQTPDAQKVKKSETFNDRITSSNKKNSSLSPSPGSGKLKKEPSLSQDELNRRVEAFINKFNEEMRLQRQQSLNQYHEMISRGAH